MKHKSLQLGFNVTMDRGATLKPLKVQLWNHKNDFKNFIPSQPFKYMGDALTALSLVKLNHHLKSPVANPQMDYTMVFDAWKNFEPHAEIYERSQNRIRALQSHISVVDPAICTNFENHFNDKLELAMTSWGVDLGSLCQQLDTFNWFEKQIDSLILYNFGLGFSKPFMEKLHTLYSFLYNLRSIVAIDHNAHIEDASHEAVKIDNIYDYLPKAEYITNDALVYWNFKKLSAPFCNPKSPDPRVERLFANPLEKVFQKYSHNACLLVDNLPHKFLSSMNPIELEEALFLVQMDWLLGSPAGLLFKIREELFALNSGYEKIFWKDIEPQQHEKAFELHLSCEINQTIIYGKNVA